MVQYLKQLVQEPGSSPLSRALLSMPREIQEMGVCILMGMFLQHGRVRQDLEIGTWLRLCGRRKADRKAEGGFEPQVVYIIKSHLSFKGDVPYKQPQQVPGTVLTLRRPCLYIC